MFAKLFLVIQALVFVPVYLLPTQQHNDKIMEFAQDGSFKVTGLDVIIGLIEIKKIASSVEKDVQHIRENIIPQAFDMKVNSIDEKINQKFDDLLKNISLLIKKAESSDHKKCMCQCSETADTDKVVERMNESTQTDDIDDYKVRPTQSTEIDGTDDYEVSPTQSTETSGTDNYEEGVTESKDFEASTTEIPGEIELSSDELCAISANHVAEYNDDWPTSGAELEPDHLDNLLVNATGCKYGVNPSNSERYFYSALWSGSLQLLLALRTHHDLYVRLYNNNRYIYGILVANNEVRVWKENDKDWSAPTLRIPGLNSGQKYTPLHIALGSGRVTLTVACDNSTQLVDDLNIYSYFMDSIEMRTQPDYWSKLIYCPLQSSPGRWH